MLSFDAANKSDNVESIKIENANQIDNFIQRFHNDEFEGAVRLYGYDNLVSEFKKKYSYLEAAGGIVVNAANDFLIIKRWDLWDLPKGKIEKGETTNQAAIREVCEETGLSNVEIKEELPHTYHIYQRKNKWHLKKTFWYIMNTKDQTILTPQTDEDITEAIWMNKNDAKKAISQSYRSISETLGFVFND